MTNLAWSFVDNFLIYFMFPPKKYEGKLITLEGGEGSGKDEMMKELSSVLEQRRIPFVIGEEPGGGAYQFALRKAMKSAENKPTDLALAFGMNSARAQYCDEFIWPNLMRGNWVLLNRFYDSTVAYQGFAGGIPIPIINMLNMISTRGLIPDRTYILDVPVEIGLERAKSRKPEEGLKGGDTFETKKIEFHNRVREGYLWLAKRDPQRIIVLDTNRPYGVAQKEGREDLERYVDKYYTRSF